VDGEAVCARRLTRRIVDRIEIKAYRLGDDARRTVGYLRRIVNQRNIPDEARVAIDGERITIEWADA
jgi:hypothetical protein